MNVSPEGTRLVHLNLRGVLILKPVASWPHGLMVMRLTFCVEADKYTQKMEVSLEMEV